MSSDVESSNSCSSTTATAAAVAPVEAHSSSSSSSSSSLSSSSSSSISSTSSHSSIGTASQSQATLDTEHSGTPADSSGNDARQRQLTALSDCLSSSAAAAAAANSSATDTQQQQAQHSSNGRAASGEESDSSSVSSSVSSSQRAAKQHQQQKLQQQQQVTTGVERDIDLLVPELKIRLDADKSGKQVVVLTVNVLHTSTHAYMSARDPLVKSIKSYEIFGFKTNRALEEKLNAAAGVNGEDAVAANSADSRVGQLVNEADEASVNESANKWTMVGSIRRCQQLPINVSLTDFVSGFYYFKTRIRDTADQLGAYSKMAKIRI